MTTAKLLRNAEDDLSRALGTIRRLLDTVALNTDEMDPQDEAAVKHARFIVDRLSPEHDALCRSVKEYANRVELWYDRADIDERLRARHLLKTPQIKFRGMSASEWDRLREVAGEVLAEAGIEEAVMAALTEEAADIIASRKAR